MSKQNWSISALKACFKTAVIEAVYQEKMMGFVIDEAHCVKFWLVKSI